MLMQTDQVDCYDSQGQVIPCGHSLQDGACRAGAAWPRPRFRVEFDIVLDVLTGLTWTRNGNPAVYPLTWNEAFTFVDQLNREHHCGYHDWRLPNRRELFSLVSHNQFNPSLPANHPFESVFPGYYWSNSTCCRLPNQAWYVHMGGGRVVKGIKSNAYLVWPVRKSRNPSHHQLLSTGQRRCFDATGLTLDCHGTLQDGEIRAGTVWAEDRMVPRGQHTVVDTACGLMWLRNADVPGREVDWESALNIVDAMDRDQTAGFDDWRLPNIIELESLCHLDLHNPAIVSRQVFQALRTGYWSGTTSVYNSSYAWVFYTEDGNIGVGHKPRNEFFVWAVRSLEKG